MKRLDRAKIIEVSQNCGCREIDRKTLVGKLGIVRNVYVDKGDGWFSCCMLMDGEEVNRTLSDVKLKIDIIQ